MFPVSMHFELLMIIFLVCLAEGRAIVPPVLPLVFCLVIHYTDFYGIY